MVDYPKAVSIVRQGAWSGAADHVALDYEARFLRRKRLVAASGTGFMVDLAEVTNLTDGDAFRLEDGRHIEIRAAPEPVLVVAGDLPRLAWHIGNRHTPCQIEPDRLVIRFDHVLEAMLRKLGATLSRAEEPFSPEGGAYGLGRMMGHHHGPDAERSHAHAHAHPHPHAHTHD